jgi:hypothetical protein
MPSLFKRAAIRGLAHELVARGVCQFPSKEAMDESADAVADGPIMSGSPDVTGPEGHSPEELAQAAQKLMEIAQVLMAQAQGGDVAGGAPPPPEQAAEAKAAALAVKAACDRDLTTAAGEAAVACMDKAAADQKLVGVGHGTPNDLAEASRHDSTARLDEKHRPQGKYLTHRGETGLDSAKGEVGHIGRPTVTPDKSPAGSNSLSSDAKKAALRGILAKHANKLVGLHPPKKNDLENSPDPVAKLDAKNRPEGAYHVGQGNTNIKEPEAARVGLETKPDVKPNLSPSGTNSVIAASKAAGEDAFLESFGKCAADVGPYLPKALSEDEKLGAITEMIPLDHGGRQAKLDELHAKVAAASCSECTPEKKCDKHRGEKKESALLARIRDIANRATGT